MAADLEAGAYVMLAVSDTGTGMHSETVSRIFEPFFTTKKEGKGTGLGLAMVYGIMKQHHGHVTVRSEPGMGSTFKMYWPALVDGDEAAQQPIDTIGNYRGNETVLLVEDEPLVRELTREILEMLGYKILEAADPEDAIRASELHQGTIHLMLTDVVMPKMDGSSLYARISPSRPDMKTLFVSGYTEHAIVLHGVLTPGVHFLQKPFSAEAIASKVREVLDAP
jgi:CheY-like chemotaxis protein